MKYPNLQAIKRQLPYGSMTIIANDLGITVKKVSDFFNKGWHKGLTKDILSRSVEIIEGLGLDDDLIGKLNDLKLTSGHSTMPVSRKKKKSNPDNPGDEIYEVTSEDIDSLKVWLNELESVVENLGYEDESQEFFNDFKELQEDFDEFFEQFEDENYPFEDLKESYVEILEDLGSLQDYLAENYGLEVE